MTIVALIAALLAGFWIGVLVERSRWVIDGVDDLLADCHDVMDE